MSGLGVLFRQVFSLVFYEYFLVLLNSVGTLVCSMCLECLREVLGSAWWICCVPQNHEERGT